MTCRTEGGRAVGPFANALGEQSLQRLVRLKPAAHGEGRVGEAADGIDEEVGHGGEGCISAAGPIPVSTERLARVSFAPLQAVRHGHFEVVS